MTEKSYPGRGIVAVFFCVADTTLVYRKCYHGAQKIRAWQAREARDVYKSWIGSRAGGSTPLNI